MDDIYNLVIETAKEYVRDTMGVEWHGDERLQYSEIIRSIKSFIFMPSIDIDYFL